MSWNSLGLTKDTCDNYFEDHSQFFLSQIFQMDFVFFKSCFQMK